LNLIAKNFFFIFILYSFCCFANQEQTTKTEVVPTLPSFLQKVESPIPLSIESIFYNQKMEKKSLEIFDNRFIIVHFWASWCMDCHS